MENQIQEFARELQDAARAAHGSEPIDMTRLYGIQPSAFPPLVLEVLADFSASHDEDDGYPDPAPFNKRLAELIGHFEIQSDYEDVRIVLHDPREYVEWLSTVAFQREQSRSPFARIVRLDVSRVLDKGGRELVFTVEKSLGEVRKMLASNAGEHADICERLRYYPNLSGYYEIDTYDISADMIGDTFYSWTLLFL